MGWLLEISKKTGTGLSYETANPYVACTPDSDEGFCSHVDTSCKPLNVARTCGSFSAEGGPCTGLDNYPNATITDYGSISGRAAMQKEIFHRGPITCGIDAMPLLNYESGVMKKDGSMVDHVISVSAGVRTRMALATGTCVIAGASTGARWDTFALRSARS